MESISAGLNDAQLKAVECISGPVLIVAGAGSGKTRVLTCRTAYLIEKGVNPEKILALTFTKKAAGEMKERIAAMVGAYNARKICMGTFHSVFIRFLRDYAEVLGYPKEFTIYDQGDSVSAVKACIKQMGLDDKVYKPKEVLSRISMAKNSLVTPAAYRNNSKAVENDRHHKKEHICDIYAAYWDACRKAGVMDFDDILFNMNILLKISPEALNDISSRFSHIMVDEYQDTNRAQYLIMRKLASRHGNLCVVGDDSQSIYAFRGAKVENILNFQEDWPQANVFRLEQNYRSTRVIVNAANSVIENNSSRIPKVCFSEAEEGEKIRLVHAYSDMDEAEQIASLIRSRIMSDKAQYQDFAILYRTNSQSRSLEDKLRKNNIPYVVYSGNSFFERAEVRDVMAYFKLVVNPGDDESFKRIVNKPARGIGDTSLNALSLAAASNKTSLFKAAFLDDLARYGLKSAAIEKIRAFCNMILAFNRSASDTDAYKHAVNIAMDSGIWPFYKSDTSIEGKARTSNVEELVSSVKECVDELHNAAFEQMQLEGESPDGYDEADLPVVTLGDYLENISLLSNVDLEDDEDTANKVALMTAHSSKGLEFPYVFIAGMEENLFPSVASMAASFDIEEERRLFYVALTRARKAVTLSFASSRMRNGTVESNSPSRFVREIDTRYILNPSVLQSDADEEDDSPSFIPYRSGKYNPAEASKGYGRRDGLQDNRRSSGPSVVRKPSPATSAPRPAASRHVPSVGFTPSPVLDLRPGQRVEHDRFGFGMIRSITKDGNELKATVLFDDFESEKILLLRYAKLRIVTED